MTCIPNWKKRNLIARRDKLQTQLAKLDSVIDEAIASGRFDSYEFESGEGKQKTRYTKLKDLQAFRDMLDLELERIYSKLCGNGVVNLGLKRYPSGRYL